MRVETMAELAGVEVYAAGHVYAGDVDLAEVRRGGPDGDPVDVLAPVQREDLEEVLLERASAEPDPGERWDNGGW